MKKQLFLFFVSCFFFSILSVPAYSASIESAAMYRYHPSESASDVRYNYHWEILQAALQVTMGKYGPYQFTPSIAMNEDRQLYELRENRGLLTVMIREASEENEKTLIPVRIPIDRNLLSYRVLLIDRKNSDLLSRVSSLEDLKKITLGQGQGWGDVDILRAAGFKVVVEVEYDKIFQRLMVGNFMGFPRGVTEVIAEYEQRKETMKNMVIEDTLLLYYPLPTYFWFPRSATGEAQAQRVNEGMNLLINNGEYERIFQKYHNALIAQLHLKDRKIFSIDNPFLPKTTPFSDERLWYDPTK